MTQPPSPPPVPGEPAPWPVVARRADYAWWVVGTVCVGAFMGQVDASVAQLILPSLERDFRASLGSVAWVAVGYLLVMAAMLPVFGRWADLAGRKRLYCGGFLVFVLGSAGCGWAPDLPILIAARLVQALGGALLSANSVALIVAAAGSQRRGRALGIQSAAQALGLCVGPVLGGFLIDTLGWRWVFWINVPVGALGILAGWIILPQTPQRPRVPFDWVGTFWLVPGLAALLLAVNEGGRKGLESPWLWVPAALAVIFLTAFVRQERRTQYPLLNLSLARNPIFAAGCVAGLISYAILFGVFLLLPFLFSRVYHLPAWESGLRLAVIPVALALGAPMGGAWSDRRGSRGPTLTGMVGLGLGLMVLALSLNGSPKDLPWAMVGLVLLGAGQGFFIAPNNSSVLSAAGPGETGEAGGLVNLMRSLGMSLGVSLAAVFLGSHVASAGEAPTPEHWIVGARHAFWVLAGLALVGWGLSWVRAGEGGSGKPSRRDVSLMGER